VTTTAVVAGCRSIAVGGRAVGILATDPALGLALIAGGPQTATGLRLAPDALVGGESLVVLGHGGGDAGRLAVSPGEAVARSGERPGVVAALQAGAAASPVLNRQGMLVGLVAGEPPADRRLADMNPAMRHGLVPGVDVARFAALHNAAPSGARTGWREPRGPYDRRPGDRSRTAGSASHLQKLAALGRRSACETAAVSGETRACSPCDAGRLALRSSRRPPVLRRRS
jgi:hypothetical protein